jgi:hypothetical protein
MVPSCHLLLEPVLNAAFIARSMLANSCRTICGGLAPALEKTAVAWPPGNLDSFGAIIDRAHFRRPVQRCRIGS